LDKKLNWLIHKHRLFIDSQIQPICYYGAFESHSAIPPRVNLQSDATRPAEGVVKPCFSFKPINKKSNMTSVMIDLSPSVFTREETPSALNLVDGWFINFSSIYIPREVQGLLQLGDNFCLSIGSNERAIVEMVKTIEHNIRRLPINNQITIRNRSAPIINKIAGHSFRVAGEDETFIRVANFIKKFLGKPQRHFYKSG